MQAPAWTDERIAELKQLWLVEGLSATLAGQKMGVSRNSILSKVHRLNWPTRKQDESRSSIIFTQRSRRVPTLRVKRRERMTEQAKARRLAVKAGIETRERLPDGTIAGTPIPPPEVISTDYLCTLFDLDNRTCRWPCWPEGTPFNEQKYCGTPTADLAEGRPYCGPHAAHAFDSSKSRPPARPYWYGIAAE